VAKVGFGIGAFIVMALAGTLGYFVGAIIGWWIGLRGGRPLLESRGRWLHVTPERLDRAEAWFQRWGNFGVLVGRVTPVVRSFVSIPAGIFEMRLAPYALYTVVGSAVWSFAIARRGLRARLELQELRPRLQVRGVRGCCRRSRARGVSHLSIKEGRYSEAP